MRRLTNGVNLRELNGIFKRYASQGMGCSPSAEAAAWASPASSSGSSYSCVGANPRPFSSERLPAHLHYFIILL
jgi:hypothetical protein